ncbi:oxidoreductase [Kiloniella sp. b19]|uniref:oxidoreductase n=1 Tax=Kiloniella sp. GXU_MW_B19 TaxID=3141326 RepID=UPI0031D50BD8
MFRKISNSGFRDWTPSQLPDLSGKTFVITGANSGIGFEAARYLGEKGGDIVMLCRSREKGEAARQKLSALVKGKVDLILIDLGDLVSVRAAAEEIREKYEKIDALINNAGIMMTPQQKTVDGFDLQMGANHLGHFLLSGLLLHRVEVAEGRIVVLSSIVHRMGQLDLDDFMSDRNYTPMKAYIQSKLSNLMFAFELDRRLKEAGSKAVCIACHPGYASTNLQSTGPTGGMKWFLKLLNRIVAQKPEAGAIPTVLSAAGWEAQRGAYYGPQFLGEYRGRVSDARVADYALDLGLQRRLWEKSEQLVDLKWGI